jgi:hypothetical protein
MNKIKLRIKWSKKEKDFIIFYPTKAVGCLISELLKPWKYLTSSQKMDRNEKMYFQDGSSNYIIKEMHWIQELVDRGYDQTTLKFEISILPTELQARFPHIYDTLSEKEKATLKIP